MTNSSLSCEKSPGQNLEDKIQIFSGKKIRLNRELVILYFWFFLTFSACISSGHETGNNEVYYHENEIPQTKSISGVYDSWDKKDESAAEEKKIQTSEQTPGQDRILADIFTEMFEQLPIFQDVSDPAFVELTIAGITFAPYLWYVGVMQPENMLIHMTQNTFNYFSSCIFWFFLMAVTQGTTKRKRRSVDQEEEKTEFLSSWSLDGHMVGSILRQIAETTEKYQRLKDEL